MRCISFVLMVAAALAFGAVPSLASGVCQPDDASIKPLPAALVPEAVKLFGLDDVDASWVERSTVIRCMDRKIWACNYGADLPCGKANSSRNLTAGDTWCAQHPQADFIPAYITGHDSVWQWRCVQGIPTTTGPPEPVDSQGYLTRYWKVIN